MSATPLITPAVPDASWCTPPIDNRSRPLLLALLDRIGAFAPAYNGFEWRTAFLASITDAQYDHVWRWARTVEWSQLHGADDAAMRVHLIPPACFAHLAHPDLLPLAGQRERRP